MSITIAVSACDTGEPREEEVAPAEEVPRAEREPEVPEIETLVPLGPDDVGERVEVEGVVVGEPVEQGFWVVNDEGVAIFVRSDEVPPSRARTEDMDYRGELRAAEAQQTSDWLERANLEAETSYAEWDVQREHYIDLTAASSAGGTQGASGR